MDMAKIWILVKCYLTSENFITAQDLRFVESGFTSFCHSQLQYYYLLHVSESNQ
jgi:hypothetical protein